MRTQKDKFMLIVGLVILGTFIFIGKDVSLYRETKALETEYQQKLDLRKSRINYNKKISKENAKRVDDTNLKDTYDTGYSLIGLLYDWSSWEMYTTNMETVGKDYPLVAKNKYIDVKGENVGTGESPKSSCEVVTTGVDPKGHLSMLVNQQLEYQTSTYEKNWYLVFEGGNKETLKLIDYYPLDKLTYDAQ